MQGHHRRSRRSVNLLESLSSLKKKLQLQLNQSLSIPINPREDERAIIRLIRIETEQANRNNITRTTAYLQYFMENPEIHWALLAHMVSRNGGWNMTDLKGEMIFNLLEGREIEDFFIFLDRSNHYIFQDAYPQLLLYRESKKRGRNLSNLLPAFHVSRFMKPFWDFQWDHQNDPYLFHIAAHMLTWALIINEQQYIQNRIVEDPFFVENVFQTWEFRLQSVLPLNLVIFPYDVNNHYRKKGPVDVTGVIIRHFRSLHQRIEAGKKLYQILFPGLSVHRGIWSWILRTPHTASRADYWPHLFCSNHEAESESKIHSPRLHQAWADLRHPEPDRKDWFRDTEMFPFFTSETIDPDHSLADVHQQMLRLLMATKDMDQHSFLVKNK